MTEYPSNSQYRSIIDVVDDNGQAIDISNTDSLVYEITDRRGGEDTLFSITDDEFNFQIEDNGDSNVANIFIEAEEITWSDVVWEELRVNFTPTERTVVLQRPVAFYETSTL